jgi:hypothetical protein
VSEYICRYVYDVPAEPRHGQYFHRRVATNVALQLSP